MALNDEQKKFVEMMQNEEVRKEIFGEEDKGKIKEILSPVDITDDDTMESLSKKYMEKLSALADHFEGRITEAKNQAVEKATEDSRRAEEAKVRKFAEDNPAMQNSEVVELMNPLYNKGMSLEDAYAKACKALDISPESGKPIDEEDDKAKDKEKKKDKPKSSAKTGLRDDETGDDEDKVGDDSDKEGKSLDEILSANSASFIAKNGDPFGDKE